MEDNVVFNETESNNICNESLQNQGQPKESSENRVFNTVDLKCWLVPSQKKNGIMLYVNGFLFNKNKSANNKFYWECNRRKHSKSSKDVVDFCGSKAVTECSDNGEHKLLKITNHNHSADASEAIVKFARFEMKNKAAESRSKPSQVIQDVTAKLGTNIQPNMPNMAAARKIISRVRRLELPKEPRQLIDLNIPENLRKTITGEMFLLKECTIGEDTILLFSTRSNICRLAQSVLWISDGTFKSVPEMFLQLYTIHAPVGTVNSVTVPLVYALMTSKKAVLYDKFFALLSELAYEFECELGPKFILVDYEIGCINAFKREFVVAILKGCYFHLGQSMYRKIQSLGLASRYGSDVEFSLQVRQVYALAFLPPSKIPEAFNELKAMADKSLKDFFLWFEENYVLGRVIQKRKRTRRSSLEIRSPPLFPPELWSVHDNSKNDFGRTTNPAESWHRRWNTLVGSAHVGTHFLTREIIKEEHKVNGDIERMIAGAPSTRKKRNLIKKEQRTQLILSKMDESNILESLRGLAYNLKF